MHLIISFFTLLAWTTDHLLYMIQYNQTIFQVLTVVTMKSPIFCDVIPCSLVKSTDILNYQSLAVTLLLAWLTLQP
jgi:hypothetical protein